MKLPQKPRVLFVSEPATSDYEYIFTKFHLGFLRLGCELLRLDPLQASLGSYKSAAETFKPDIIFCMLRNTESVCAGSELLNHYHPTVALNWFQEDPNNVTAEMLECSRRFDYWFTQDARMVPFWPTKAIYSPHAFDETVYSDHKAKREFDVSFTGHLGNPRTKAMLWPYMERLSQFRKRALMCIDRPMGPPLLPHPAERLLRWKKLRPLLQRLPIWKCAWEHPTTDQARAWVVNRSKVHLGISRVRGPWEESVRALVPSYPFDEHGLFYQCKGRLFHAVGAGALALNDYFPELDGMFDAGKEIVTYRFGNPDEMEDKLKYYLAHDTERERIARAGYERGRKQHTFVARIQQIFERLRQDSQP